YKGQPVTSGFVTMVGSDGIAKQSEIGEDGSYKVTRVPLGDVKIAVSSPPIDSKKTPPGKGAGATRKGPDRGGAESEPIGSDHQKKTWREIPLQYSDITNSNLKYTVTSGANSHDIKLD